MAMRAPETPTERWIRVNAKGIGGCAMILGAVALIAGAAAFDWRAGLVVFGVLVGVFGLRM